MTQPSLQVVIAVFPAPGHAHGMVRLGHALAERGHRVTFTTPLDGVALVSALTALPVTPFAEQALPLGTLRREAGGTIRRAGLDAVRGGVGYLVRLNLAFIEAAEALATPSVIVADELYFGARTVAERLGLRWVSVAQALSIRPSRDGRRPPPFARAYPGAPWRNRLGWRLGDWLFRDVRSALNQARAGHGLAPHASLDETFSPDLHLRPYTATFGGEAKEESGLVGPFIELLEPESSERPRQLYASFGTLVDDARKLELFGVLQAACQRLELPATFSWGAWPGSTATPPMASTTLVKVHARVDQRELLRTSRVMVTHGGLNSVQESLATCTSMLVVPLKHDQHGIAARVTALGLGQSLAVEDFTVERVTRAIDEALRRDRTSAFQQQQAEARRSGGLARAVELLERLATRTPGLDR